MEIESGIDCGNSPKMAFVRELTILFASYQLQKLKDFFADDIRWQLVGDEAVIGKENFIRELDKMADHPANKLILHSIVSHGKHAAVHGTMKMPNGDQFGFSDFYVFKSAGSKMIQSITSYVIALN